MKTFDTVAKLKLAKLKEGQFVETGGYYAKGGAGAARYLIVIPRSSDGYGDHELANGNIAVLQVKGEVDVKQFGAKGDGVVDDQPAIQAAADYGYSQNTEVFIPPGTYLCYLPLVLGSTFYGVGDESLIEFPEGFVKDPSVTDDRRYFVMWNKNYSKVYDESTADAFEIHHIKVYVSMLDSEPILNNIIGTANTKGVEIHHCTVDSADLELPKTGARTCIAFYDANKNLKIHNNVLYNNNTRNGGGAIWVQGGSGLTLDDPQASENIRIFKNTIYQNRPDDADEAIALWGASGVLKNVRVYRNTLYLNGGGQGATVFNTASTTATTGAISDIVYEDNTFYTKLEFNVIRVGGQHLSDDITDITVRNNRIFCESDNTSQSYGIRVTKTGSDISITGNYIKNTGIGQMSRGIAGYGIFDWKTTAEDNTIVGDFAEGMSFVYYAVSNKINGATFGLNECVVCTDNKLIDIVTYGARLSIDENWVVNGNTGNLLSGASYTFYQTSGSSGEVSLKNNEFDTATAGVLCALLQGSGSHRVQLNTFRGLGNAAAVGNLLVSTDNDYYGIVA